MNPSAARLKRERPQREAPIRNRLTQPPRTNGVAADQHGRSASTHETTPTDKLREALECGVRTAYTVIDEYLQRGYEAARSNRDHPENRGYMRDDKQSFGGWSNSWSGPFGPTTGPLQQPIQQWMNLMRAWTEVWSQFIPGGFPQQMCNTGPEGHHAANATPAVSVNVVSHRPTSVTASLNLYPGVDLTMLTVGWLTGEGSHPPLKGVSIRCEHGSLRVHVPVAADQPAGRYQCEITGPDGRCAGKLSIVITDLEGKAA